jgi:1-acyl-sn-glycerol-3-phosphate acyltransferase
MKILQKTKAVGILIEFIVTVSVVIALMALFNKYHWQIRRVWAKIQAWLIGYELEVVGSADPEADMVILNHQSLLDIILIEANYPKNIAINREDKKSLLKLFSDCKERLEEGRVIAIFPEGTRGDGKTIAPFKAGTKLIASKLKLKVQPAVIVNTRNILDSQKFVARKGKVKLIYLDSFYVKENKNWFEDIQKDMQDRLNKELGI